MPISVHAFTVALAAVAVLGAAATGTDELRAPAYVVAPLAATLLVAGLIQLEFRWRGHRVALDLVEAALVPTIAVFAGPGAVLLVAVTKAVSQRLLRVVPIKAAFNVAQWSASAAAASVVYDRFPRAATIDVGALALALVAAMLVNHLAVAIVIALARRGTLRDVLAGLAPIVMPGWVVAGSINVSFGLMYAATVVAQPGLAVLFVVPLVVLGWAEKAYTEVVTDRTRIEVLQRATHALAARTEPADALPHVLEAVRCAFSAGSVGVVLPDGTQLLAGEPTQAIMTTLATAGSLHDARRVSAKDETDDGVALAAYGHQSALVAPLRSGGRRMGTLVSIDREGLDGFEAGEVAVFETLAGEIASALERAELHATIVREREHLLDVIEGSSDGIFTVTSDGTIEDWNPAMADITGFPATEAKNAGIVAVLRPRTVEGVEVPLEQWQATGLDALPAEIVVLTRTGKPRTLACSFSETTSGHRSLIVVARDVTRQRELDQLRDDFVATVSHELRTPLTSIIGFTSMLIEPPRPLAPHEHDEAVAMIRKGARRLERLVFNLLEVARIENRAQPKPGPVDITEACENSIAELKETWPHRDIRIARRGSGAVRAIGNQLSVEQVLTNLIANALKYSDRGPVEVTVEESHDSLTVSVTDHGPGISPADQERIFDRFHRIDHHHVQAGTGLGLYISRQLATAMGGTLTVVSDPGHGSTFSLTLPAELHLVAVS